MQKPMLRKCERNLDFVRKSHNKRAMSILMNTVLGKG